MPVRLSLPRRPLWGALLLGASLYLVLSLRVIEAGKGAVVLDSRWLPVSPRRLAPGWRFVPAGLFRLSDYPATPSRFPFHLPLPNHERLVSSEGVGVEVEGSLTYRAPSESVLRLHARAMGDPDRFLVAPLLTRAAGETLRRMSFSRVSGAHRFELESTLERVIGPKLRESGLDLVNLRVDAVRMAGGSLGGVSLAPIPGTRALVIGLDGADWKVIDPLLAQGKLPNLAHLIDSGVRARLRTIDPILSPVVWTTAATGFLPPEHGILDFLATDTRTGQKVPVTSRQRKVKAIWNLLAEAGVPVGIIGYWATWPAEPVDGYIVTDRVAYQLMGQSRASDDDPRGKTFPPDLYRRIRPLVIPPETIGDSDLAPFIRTPEKKGGWSARSENRVDDFRTVLASSRTYEGIALALASGGFQPLEIIYFEGIDTTSHLFMPFRPPRRPTVPEADFVRFSKAVDAFYVHQDEVIGRLLEAARPDTNILVLSDHGFRSDADRPARESRIGYATAALWHRRYGILIATGPAFKQGTTISEVSVVDVAPTVLALFGLPVGEDMQGRPAVDLLRPEFLAEHPIRFRPSWETGRAAPVAETSDPAGDQALKEKLLSLGYLSQEGTLSRNNLGNSLLARGDVQGAIREFRRAAEEAPGFALPRINLARAHVVQGDLKTARGLLEEALRSTDEFPEAEVLLANIEREEGDPRGAERRLRRLLEREPSALVHRSLGLLAYEQGKRAEAAEEYRKAIAIEPDDPEGYNNLGVLLKEDGKPEEAAAQFRKALEVDPNFAGSYNNLALLAMDREDWETAGEMLRQALARLPDDPMIHNNQGNYLFRRERWAEAESEFRKALALRSDYAEPHNGIASVLARKGDWEGEIREYRKALQIQPRYADARVNLARRLIALGRGREAEQVCQEGVRLSGDRLELWNLLGESALLAGDRKGAEEAYQSSLERDPRQSEARRRLDDLRRGSP
ncbi:MAG TPA: tetratricopeptide repeat protein [Candidatus Polarisedimenticolia bacterium]|nr:tetratricopeptide repeat protein [Candidatus Polarisedimenticolia bacterium]